MLNTRLLLVLLVVTMGLAPAWAQEDSKGTTTKPTTQESASPSIASTIAEWDTLNTSFMKEVRSQPRNKQRAFFASNKPDVAPYLDTVKRAVAMKPSGDAAAAGLTFILEKANREDTKTKSWAMDLSAKHHGDNAKLMGVIISGCERDYQPAAGKQLDSLAKHSDIQIAIPAAFAAIERMKGHAGAAKRYSGISEAKMKQGWIDHFGDEVIAGFADVDKSKTDTEVAKRLTAMSKNPNLAKVKRGRRGTYADAVNDQLFVLNNLAVGKTAPDINGTDVDGAAFKLSDYRGKAVLLDFWGHW